MEAFGHKAGWVPDCMYSSVKIPIRALARVMARMACSYCELIDQLRQIFSLPVISLVQTLLMQVNMSQSGHEKPFF